MSIIRLSIKCLLALGFFYLLVALGAEIAGSQHETHGTRPLYHGPLHHKAQQLGLLRSKQASWIVIALQTGALWLATKRDSFEESLLVIRGLGIQISTSSPSYLSTASTRFIPTTQIQDIFIHEAFKGFAVKFYLAVIVQGEKEAVVVFPKLMPRREILEEVWRGSREALYQKSKP